MNPDMPELAAHYSAIGLALVAIEPGGKAPQGADAVGWQATQPISPDEARGRWAGRHLGKGLGCVHEHSATFVLDVDDELATRASFAAVGLDLDEILAAGIQSKSPKALRRKAWFTRPPGVAVGMLAVMWRGDDGKSRKIVEFRSRGQDVLPPTPYPGGGGYEWVGDETPSSFPAMPLELVAMLADWPAARAKMRAADPNAPVSPRPAPPRPPSREIDADASDWKGLRRQIRARIAPSEILRRNGIALGPGGKCCCPFHPEDNPSFWVFSSRAGGEMWNCAHGTAPVGLDGDIGNSIGDAIDLECFFRSMSIGDATVSLAQELGLALPGSAAPLGIDFTEFEDATRARGVSAGASFAPVPAPIVKPDPLPAHLLNVPGFIGEFMRWQLATAPVPQPVFALASAIALQGVLTAAKVRDERGNRTNIYLVCTGGSGAGKGWPQKTVEKALMFANADKLLGSGEIASDAGLARMIENQRNILIQVDEFGRTLKSMMDERANHLVGISTALIKLWSCADSIWLGKVYSNRENNIRVEYPCVGMIGYTVPKSFYMALSPDSLSDGLLARLILLEGDDDALEQDPLSVDPPSSIVETIKSWVAYAPNGDLSGGITPAFPNPALVPTTPDARERFRALKNIVAAQPRNDDDGGSIWARAVEQSMRLALIYACSADREHPIVNIAAASWACDLMEHRSRRILTLARDWLAATDFDRIQKRIVRALRAAGGIASKTEICRAIRDIPKRLRDDALVSMVEAGVLVQKTEPTNGSHRSSYGISSGF